MNTKILLDEKVCTALKGETVQVSYRSFNENFEKRVYSLDTTLLEEKERIIYIGADLIPDFETEKIIGEKDLNYSGSFTRGFSVGNAQSLVLNSNFDLQLNGKMGGGLDIVAAISDDNIPIQPEGNTQLIQEFDRVFIKVGKEKTSLIAGDYELRRPIGYFQNYFKKLKGLNGETTIGDDTTFWKTSANIAISRGKFARQNLETREGNQGPYKLRGNNGEIFFQVLSGTEKVYFNGILLKRGFDYDYVIDYNRGELSFTPNRSIRQDSRVIVEFEYTDLNYQRAQYTLNTQYQNKNSTFYINFYNEQDSKTTTNQIELDSSDIANLMAAGDNINSAARSGIRVIDENQPANIVKYKRIENEDFPQDPNEYILIYSTNPDSALYTATFSIVGEGEGSYEIDEESLVNGRVYKYVGMGNGSFQPIIRLVPPEKRQMTSFGAKHRFNKRGEFFGELSMSNFDLNRFSDIGNDDNKALGFYGGLTQEFNFDSLARWRAKFTGLVEYKQADFNFLNPYRNAEFVRDWNISNNSESRDELLTIASTELIFNNKNTLGYNYSSFDRENIYEGTKHVLTLTAKHKDFKLEGNYNVLNTEETNSSTRFVRPYLLVEQGIDFLAKSKVSFYFEREKNELFNEIGVLREGSRSYDLFKFGYSTDITRQNNFRFSINRRNDHYFNPQNNSLSQTLQSDEYEVSNSLNSSKYIKMDWTLLSRNFKVLNQELAANEKSKKTLLGQLNMSMNLWKGSVIGSTNYSLGSGQEPKLEYYFEKVESGQGDYIYVNGDPDTIANLNVADFRFDPSNPQSNFIRLSLFNNEYVITDQLTFNQSLRWEPRRLMSKVKRPPKWMKLLSKVAISSSFRLNKKKENEGEDTALQPFDFSTSDPDLTVFSSQILNTFFINRGEVAYDLEFSERRNEGRTNLINGLETRNVLERSAKLRINLIRKVDLRTEFIFGEKTYDSQLLEDRNFIIDYYSLSPMLSFRPSSQLRFITSYDYSERNQKIGNQESAISNEFMIEISRRSTNKMSLDFSMSYVNVKYDDKGEANSAIEYDMLEGLRNGNNFLWRINFTKRLSTSLDLNLNYEGRKTGVSPVIHVARAQVKASF